MIIFAGIDGTGEWLNWNYRETFQNSHVKKLSEGRDKAFPLGVLTWIQLPFYHRGPRLFGNDTYFQANKAYKDVLAKRQANPTAKLFLSGYSRGGAGVIEVAHWLKANQQTVDAIFLFDAVDKAIPVGGMPAIPLDPREWTPPLDPKDPLNPDKWVHPPGRPISSNVKHVYHARRHKHAKSRESFGNCGFLLENRVQTGYEEEYFLGTHGGIGGTPWKQSAVPQGQKYINEGGVDGPTTITPTKDKKASDAVWVWMIERIKREINRGQTKVPGTTPGAKKHKVAAGESLSVIAGKHWDDVLLWPLIYDANVGTIGPKWNLIKPGQVLIIPDISKLTPTQLNKARQRGRNWK